MSTIVTTKEEIDGFKQRIAELEKRVRDMAGFINYARSFLPEGLHAHCWKLLEAGVPGDNSIPQEVWQQMGNWPQNSLGQMGSEQA